jgi:DNA polymerase III alpha subunit (gram-positive type)
MTNESNLIWIDMEMTGLKPEVHRVIEIAAIVTDKDLMFWLRDRCWRSISPMLSSTRWMSGIPDSTMAQAWWIGCERVSTPSTRRRTKCWVSSGVGAAR